MLLRKCLILFLLGLAVDVTQTLHIQACADRQITTSVLTVVVIYLIGFWGHDWFVNARTYWHRWMMTASAALGAGLGTWLVIYFGG